MEAHRSGSAIGLEGDGLVRREPDPADRRGVRVVLTPRGRERVDRALETRFAETAAAVLPERDRAALEKLLARLLARLEDEPDGG